MSLIPTSCVDDFYEDPDSIREYALSLDYKKEKGNYPGMRTKDLFYINKDFSQWSINRVLSLFFPGKFKWRGMTMFQKIYPIHEDPNHILNQGEIHFDDGYVLAGLIYLNPSSRLDSGTSIYQLKEEHKDYTFKGDILQKIKCYRDGKCEAFEKELGETNSRFDRILEIKNVYNRLLMYNADLYHSQTNMHMGNDDFRLTQVFFIKEMVSEMMGPLHRSKQYSQKELLFDESYGKF